MMLKIKNYDTTNTTILQGTKKGGFEDLPLCDPLGVRTQDPNIKSVVLYQLS